MIEDYTQIRVHKDIKRRLKVIAEKHNRSVPRQIEEFVEREEMLFSSETAAPTHPTAQEPQS